MASKKANPYSLRNLITKAHNLIKSYCANYAVIDDCGTHQLTWTLKGARAWLPFCGSSAYICRAYSYSIIEGRSY